MVEEENYQHNYRKLLRFLTRGGGGYAFVLVDDARYIRQINESLKAELGSQHNIQAAIIFLDDKSDEPVPHQLTVAAEKYGVLLVANMYEIARDTKDGRAATMRLNFNREAIQSLPCKIVFWVQEKSLAFVANFAPDLYVQRALSTIHFTGVMESLLPDMPKTEDWAHFLNTERFKDTEARIATFKRRLEDAEKAGYPPKRIADEIALPLAQDYAGIGMRGKAEDVLERYLPVVNQEINELQKLGDIYYSLHNLNKAAYYWQIVVDKSDKELLKLPEDNAMREKIGISLSRLGDIYTELGYINQAEECFKRAVQISEELYRNNPNILSIANNLAIYYSRLGGIYNSKGELEQALSLFLKWIKLAEGLFKINPNSESLKNNLAISYERIGDTYQSQGKFENAFEYFWRAVALFNELYDANPSSESFKKGLSFSYLKLGDIYMEQGKFAQALEYFEKMTKLSEDLFKVNPHSESQKIGLALSYSKQGELHFEKGESDTALYYFKLRVQLAENFFKANPDSINLRNFLAVSYANIGSVYRVMGDKLKARSEYEKAEKIWMDLSEKASSVPKYKEYLSRLRENLQQLQSP